MLADHYAENAPMKDVLKLKPDWAFYMEEQKFGRFLFITARARTGEIVGYTALLLRRHPHYADTIVAVDDVHYLMPAYRGQGYGKHLIAFSETAARERGARLFSMRCKADQDHGFIFESLGYRLTDLVYIKELTDAP